MMLMRHRVIETPIAQVCLLGALYFITGKLGLLLAVPLGYATIIWPPSGFALGAVIVYGWRLWPGILIGSFLLNSHISGAYSVAHGFDVEKTLVALAIAIGSTLQALAGRALVQRFLGLPLNFNYIRDVVALLALAGPLACLIAATIGISALVIAGVLPAEKIVGNWLTWWVGDVTGVIVFLPLILLTPGSKHQVRWRGGPYRLLTGAGPIGIDYTVRSYLLRVEDYL